MEILYAGLPPFASITQMMQRLRLTARAIRFYEERGLIEVARDRQNWRRYDRKAQARLAMIAICRQAGLSLTDASEILDVDGEGRSAQFSVARQKLAKRLEALENDRRNIEKLMTVLEDAPGPETYPGQTQNVNRLSA